MSDDPLTAFVARSLRGNVSEVRSEIVTKNAAVEIERIRFKQDGTDRTLVLKRVPPDDAVEVQLLPLLARKTDRVPRLLSRGIPPAAVPAWPWVLTEDLLDARSACHGGPEAIVRAKVAVERAVAADGPALKALGVRSLSPVDLVEHASERSAIDRPIDAAAREAAGILARLPTVLCHGELVCANVRLAERGPVLVEWRRAYLGCALLDIARLAADENAFTGRDAGDAAFALYGQLTSGVPLSDEFVNAAKVIDRAVRGPRS